MLSCALAPGSLPRGSTTTVMIIAKTSADCQLASIMTTRPDHGKKMAEEEDLSDQGERK